MWFTRSVRWRGAWTVVVVAMVEAVECRAGERAWSRVSERRGELLHHGWQQSWRWGGAGWRAPGVGQKAQANWQVGPDQFKLFLYFISSQTLKFKIEAFTVPKNIQILYEARFEHCKQLSPLAELQIPTGSYVIKFGTDSNLNLSWILTGFKPCGKNLVNSLKLYIDFIFTKLNLVGYTCMQEIEVPIHVSIWLDLKIRKRVWIWNSNQPHLDFIQASKLHSEVLWKHCSYYSDTRGVTLLEVTTTTSIVTSAGSSLLWALILTDGWCQGTHHY
jgi:hypothetical protein